MKTIPWRLLPSLQTVSRGLCSRCLVMIYKMYLIIYSCVWHVAYTPLVISCSCDIRKRSAPCCSGVTCERWTRAAAAVTMELCADKRRTSPSIHPLLLLLILYRLRVFMRGKQSCRCLSVLFKGFDWVKSSFKNAPIRDNYVINYSPSCHSKPLKG